jgi:hypothetical protein
MGAEDFAQTVAYTASISLDLIELGTSAQCQVYELLLSAKNLLSLETRDQEGYELSNWHAELRGRPFHENVIAGYALLRIAQLILNDENNQRIIITDPTASNGTANDTY